MTERVLDLSERPVRLNVQNSLLLIRPLGSARQEPTDSKRPEEEGKTYPCERLRDPARVAIPLADIAVLIASHPQISFTHAVLSGLASAGGAFVACDEKHMPIGMLLPLAAHSLQAERFAAQAAMSLPAKKRAWKRIVRAKISAQGRLLVERSGRDHGLSALCAGVRSGDPGNVEAQAARLYWPALFGLSRFRRDTDGDGLNACLNYGYAVLRAITARALCAAGLHPSLGIHHHNRYDAFCLADDLMEPFRPVVDREVARLVASGGADLEFDKEAKRSILQALLGRFSAQGESRSLFDWLGRSASSLAALIVGTSDELKLPVLEPGPSPLTPDADT